MEAELMQGLPNRMKRWIPMIKILSMDGLKNNFYHAGSRTEVLFEGYVKLLEI